MKLYRGVKEILFRQIDPLFRNNEVDHLTYGSGTSYSTEAHLAQTYCEHGRKKSKFGWLLTYNFTEKNLFNIEEDHFMEPDDHESQMFFDGTVIQTKELAKFLSDKGHDSVDLDYDGFEPHILLLEKCHVDQLILEEAALFTEDEDLVKRLKKLDLVMDGKYFIIPHSKLNEVDSVLQEFIS